MHTGFEGYTLSELERIAYGTQNFLAQEILERVKEAASAEYAREAKNKKGTQWKGASHD